MDKKYLLIDGNNLAVRCAFANHELQNSVGVPSGVHFGFFQSLIKLRCEFPGYQMLIAWDGRSYRRVALAQEAVDKGIVPSGYKGNRSKDDIAEPLRVFYDHSDFLKRALHYAGIPQIRYAEFEADDVIATYAKILENTAEDVILVTSDNDYYQLITSKVSIYDGMAQKYITLDDFCDMYAKLTPSQMVDLGAITGDTSDNIFGIPSWGAKTAHKYLQEYDTVEKLRTALNEKYKDLRVTYPDIQDPDELKFLQDLTIKSGKAKYNSLYLGMPYSGVLQAYEKGLIKKISKAELMFVVYQERLDYSYSLKKMDIIDGIPDIEPQEPDANKIKEYLDYFDIKTLQSVVHVLWDSSVTKEEIEILKKQMNYNKEEKKEAKDSGDFFVGSKSADEWTLSEELI